MERKEAIRGAYRMTGGNDFYDGMITCSMPALCNVDYASMELLHAKLVRTTTCVDGCRCDYAICGDQDPYGKEHPEYRDEAGFRRNK